MNISRSSGIARLEPSLTASEIPKSAYKSRHNFPRRNVKSVSTREILICSKEIPNKVIEKVLKTFLDHVPELVSKYPLTSQVSKIDPQKSFYYPLDPGALAIYQQNETPTFTPNFFLSLISLLLTQLLTARYALKYFKFRLIFRDLYEIDSAMPTDTYPSVDFEKRLCAIQEKTYALYIEGKITYEASERLLKYAELLSAKAKKMYKKNENGVEAV